MRSDAARVEAERTSLAGRRARRGESSRVCVRVSIGGSSPSEERSDGESSWRVNRANGRVLPNESLRRVHGLRCDCIACTLQLVNILTAPCEKKRGVLSPRDEAEIASCNVPSL